MGYVESTLMPNEEVVYETTLHWVIYVPGMSAVAFGLWLWWNFADGKMLLLISLVPLLWGIVTLIVQAIIDMTTEIAVTNHRIIFKTGLIARDTMEMNLKQIESTRLSQGVIERILKCGTVSVLGTGSGIEMIGPVGDPLELIEKIQEGKSNRIRRTVQE